MRWLALLVLALALVAAGCGGGDDESAGSDETAIEEATTTETTSEDTTTEETTDTDVDVSGILDDEDCLQLAGIGATFAQAVTGASDQEAAEEIAKLADEVPDEIKADVQVLADWFADYAAKLEDIGLQAGQTPSAEQLAQLQAVLADTNQEELTAASERLQAWSEENCTG
ncbi:MAG TPA: hypothetical protein VFT94_05685 [Gaiellaceae bacterium]|nr:hypothetical protein [Gaiellaceae bacterium]